MKLLELSLLAYGPFSGERLDLSAPGLQVVFGPNEAGKSTSLRAITGLLYGIAERTGDNHLHGNKGLRIGGKLSHQGEVLEVVRRKGRRKTLLDPAGDPIDEARLTRMLGGVSRELFLTMFGLDHRSLRDGAEALLRGEGAVGESLFDAGGARGVGLVLSELRDEADALYKARGHNQPMAEALKDYEASKTQVLTAGSEPGAFRAQEAALAETQRDRDGRIAARDALTAERLRLERARRVLPKLAERRALVAERASLGDGPRLLPDARAQRRDAEARLATAAHDEERLTGEIEALERERSEVAVDEELARLDPEVVQRLRDALGLHLKAEIDLPKRLAKQQQHEDEARRRLQELGREASLETIEKQRVDEATAARIHALADQQAMRRSQQEAAARRLAELDARLQALDAERVDLGPPLDPAPLAAACARARRAGSLDERVDEAEAELARLEAELAAALQALPRFHGSLDELLALKPPTRGEVEAAGEVERRRVARLEELRRRRESAEEQATTAAVERAALSAGGELPSLPALTEARVRRDEAVGALEASGGRSDFDRVREAIIVADGLADRLRYEADRVARAAQLDARRAAAEEAARAATLAATALEEEAVAEAEAWKARWPGVEAGPPRAMIEWLDARSRIIGLAATRHEVEAKRREIEQRRLRLREGVIEALAGLDPVAPQLPHADDARLDPVLDAAEPLAERLAERELRREQLAGRRREVEAERSAQAEAARQADEAWRGWRARWAEAMAAVGLDGAASVEEARVVMAALRDVFDQLRGADEMARRVEGMRRDAEQFEAMVAPLAAAFLSRAVGAEVSACAREVLRRYELAGQDLARRDAIDQRLAAARQQHLEAARRAEAARRSLEELARDAGVADPGGLEEAERRDEERRRLEARLASLDEALFTEGMTLDELSAAVAGADVEAARLRLDAIEEELAEVNEAVSALDRQLATQQEGLLRLLRKEGAFAAAADQQTVLARIAHLAERWARLRLASHILEQEVQRYRERNEGPIIRRASAIFPELTLGEYVALRSSYDERDEAELRCLGADGADVGVEALSDGTRDQLYLALRLASLERHAERGELLPLVVDDILVHFDEDRARAALSVLHRFSEVTQVLMFTHHARHVEIARQCLPEGGVVVHELTGGRRSAKAV